MISNKTPFEALYNRPPSLSHLRVFGCQCYTTVVHPKHKLDPRATKCIFVGYPHGQKGYKLYDLATEKFFVSRDVRFYEHIFPFSSLSTETTSPLLPNLGFDETYMTPQMNITSESPQQAEPTPVSPISSANPSNSPTINP